MTGKRVLDVGVVNHRASEADRTDWLHAALARSAASCLGIDILPDEVRALRERGCNVVCHNILDQPLGQKFEVIVCGELVEHLDAPGRLLEIAAPHLEDDGRLVLTTPNPYYLARLRDALLGRTTESVDHVTLCWPSGAAELGERHGLKLVSYRGVKSGNARTLTGSVMLLLFKLATKLAGSDDVLCHTWILEFQPIRVAAAARNTEVS